MQRPECPMQPKMPADTTCTQYGGFSDGLPATSNIRDITLTGEVALLAFLSLHGSKVGLHWPQKQFHTLPNSKPGIIHQK